LNIDETIDFYDKRIQRRGHYRSDKFDANKIKGFDLHVEVANIGGQTTPELDTNMNLVNFV